MKHSRLILLAALAALTAAPGAAQEAVDLKKYPDFSPQLKKDDALRAKAVRTERPAYVNNAETPYFPAIINQVSGSCGSASRIAYMFGYEINRLRGTDASLPENRYPTHFTWLLTNSGSSKDAMAIANGVPNAVTYGGYTYSELFGIQDCSDPDFGWMQGYDKWYAAMHNRLERTANFPLSVETEEGREAVKQWLWNHGGNPDYPGGGICGFGVASGGVWEPIPATDANDATGVTGKYYVKQWGAQVDHALTIVGYDDRIEFDLDGNGIAGEKDKDEVGAWIVANSWGDTWCNNGFIYCPYKNAVTTAGGRDYYYPEVYYIRRDYRPLRTLRIKMDYSKRSELQLSAGISTDLNATEPERTVAFEHFKYAGDGNNDGIDAETPMLGRWTDGLHTEPMEFGYDLTDLSAAFDTRRPLKYFFIIESKGGASGTGTIHDCALIDYEFDHAGIETAFDLGANGVTVQNKGKKTIVSVVVAGEPFNAPRNLVMTDGTLHWEAPAASAYELTGYAVYADDALEATLPATTTSHVPAASGAVYQVAAVYAYGADDRTVTSACTAAPPTAYCGTPVTDQLVREFNNSGLRIKDIFKENRKQVTLEYWLKPTSRINWNQQMGPGWSSNFMTHTTSVGQWVFGWNTGARVTTDPNTLRLQQWRHFAIVVDGNTMRGYVDGELVGEVSSAISGIGGFGDLDLGTANTSSGIVGQLDEVRIWSTARSQRDIQAMMYARTVDPANTPGLLAELTMSESGVPVDATGHFTVEQLNGTQSQKTAATYFSDKRVLAADFSLPEGAVYVGSPVVPVNLASANAVSSTWVVDGDTDAALTLAAPTLIFTTPGEHTVALTVTGPTGETATASRTLNVAALPAPTAAFTAPETVPVGHRVSFTNATTPADGAAYEWLMPGGDTERATTVNAATTYSAAGTYTVTLKATNAAGSATVSRQIKVTEVAPEVDFAISPAVVLKGATVTLTDNSKYQPTSWHWTVSDNAHYYVFNTPEAELQLNDPGTYDVTLSAANAIGSGTLTRSRAITVCNADAVTGLNFTGSAAETVTFNNPLDLNATDAFTMDWWMYAKQNAEPSQHIGGSAADFMITARSNGALVVNMGKMTYETGAGYIETAEWHHYALTFNFGDIKLYKDGRQTHFFPTPWMGAYPTMPEQFSIGGAEGPMNAIIDELRIWNSCLSQADINAYANAPIADVNDAMKRHALQLYYNFNQDSGNVLDATPNANTGVRSGFGPEGDAWTTSLGVFCLGKAEREDVTAAHLTNYSAPFLHTGTAVSADDKASNYVELLTGDDRSTWQIENAIAIGQTLTTLCVDTDEGDQLVLATKYADFESQVTDHKLYQTVTLPAGHYVFGIEMSENSDAESYVVVAAGQGLPLTADLSKQALGYATLPTGEVSFSVYNDTEVSLGLLMNTRGEMQQHFSRFYLEKKLTNDDFTWTSVGGITADAGTTLTLTPVAGGVNVEAAMPTAVSIHNLAGVCLYRATVSGTRFVALPAGLYVANGRKFIVR